VNFNVGPHWRIETGAVYYELKSPLPDNPLDPASTAAPDFALRESTGRVGVKYTTEAKFSVGLEGSYGEGRFSGITDAPDYQTTTGDLTLGYKATEIDDFGAHIGYTRLSSDETTVNGFSGDLSYLRHLSALTSIKLEGFRRMAGYLAGADAVVDTGAGGELTWQPTLKIRLAGGYTYTHSKFEALSSVSNDAGRVDELHLSQLTIGYQMFEWLGLKVFGGYRDRRSNRGEERFNDTYVGAQLRFSWPMGIRDEEEDATPAGPVFNPDMPRA
jgi:hypothetical protein